MPQPNWQPAESTIPDLLDDLMWMTRISHDGHTIEQYKHRDTRRYINLDETGRPYRVRVDGTTGNQEVEPISLVEARTWLTS